MLLRKRAEEILDMVDKAASEFKALDKISGSDILIGCAESEGITYFLRVVKKLQKEYPNIRCHFYSSGSDAVDERLDKGLLNFAIIVQEVDSVKYNSSLAGKEVITHEDLLDLPLICSRQSLNEKIPKWFGEEMDKLNLVCLNSDWILKIYL